MARRRRRRPRIVGGSPRCAIADLGGLALLALLVAGCGTSATPTAGPSRAPVATPQPVATSISTPAPTPTATPSGTPIPTFDAARVQLQLERVVAGLDAPLAIANAGDGGGRLFVVEQAGRIRVIRDGRLETTPFLDIRDRIEAGGERGLLGLAFHPGFPGDPRLFVDYTDRDGNTVVSSFAVPSATPDRADPESERVLLRIEQPYPNHNGGALAFGPDGDLYIATGDGGSAGDPHGNGQDLDTLLGKLLRIRVGPADGSGPPYLIPPDAPFAVDARARPEIRAYGLRNPWRFSFDRLTGDLWIGDVGQGDWEEVDRLSASAPPGVAPNFGWNVMEGDHCFGATSCREAGLVRPVAEYGHDQGCSIVGGFVARDPAQPLLYGGYLFADYCSGRIWALDAAWPEPGEPVLLLDSGHVISSFGEDEAGSLYLTDLASGELLRIVATSR